MLVARSTIGPVIVRCESVGPYLDGYKVRLLVTVLAPIEVNELNLTVNWMEKDDKYHADGNGWREKTVESLVVFQPGRYSAIDVPLTPASAAGVKSMTVSAKDESSQDTAGAPSQIARPQAASGGLRGTGNGRTTSARRIGTLRLARCFEPFLPFIGQSSAPREEGQRRN